MFTFFYNRLVKGLTKMTLKEIAKMAGVSIATVSYALNDSDKVSDAVKQKILKIANDTNYQPDKRAQSLRTGRTRLLGILTEDIAFDFTSSIIKGVYRYAEENDYHVILSDSGIEDKLRNEYDNTLNYKDAISKRLAILEDYHVDGIIYIGMHDRDISGLVETKKPIVYTYCFTDSEEDYMVLYDNCQSAYDVTNYLIKSGHRKIGLVRGNEMSNPSNERFMGYQKALMDAKIPLDLSYVKTGNWSFDKGYTAGLELLQREDRPTAIFALNDFMALGVLEAAAKCNIKVPEELSVVGFDNYDMCDYIRPNLTSVSVPVQEMGYVSAQMIDKICTGPDEIQEHKVILPCKMVIRDSVSEAKK